MIRMVRIVSIQDTYFIKLEDNNKKTYLKDIEFYDTEISVGDCLFIPDEVLDELNMFVYGPVIEDNDPIDLITLFHSGKEITLQRYYG